MADTPDLARIVGLIMENPELISKIQGLAKSDSSEGDGAGKVNESADDEVVETAASDDARSRDDRQRRARLLHALKPYLSSERAKAIDSMISMAEIIDMMKQR